jgi:hypothetical protein
MKKMIFAALAALGILASAALVPAANAAVVQDNPNSYAGGNG